MACDWGAGDLNSRIPCDHNCNHCGQLGASGYLATQSYNSLVCLLQPGHLPNPHGREKLQPF